VAVFSASRYHSDSQSSTRPTPRGPTRAFLGELEDRADECGAIVVPFSRAPSRTPMLLACGDIATVAHLDLRRETCELAVAVLLDREALTAGRTARGVARISLTVEGAPASLALLQQPTWDANLTDRSDPQKAAFSIIQLLAR